MLISNNNYAANSDYIFAETVDHRRFGELNDKSIFISEKNAASVTYKSTMLHISDGDTIFCRTDYIDELFYLIKKTEKINLKLIKFPLFCKEPVSLMERDKRSSYVTLPENLKFSSKTNSVPLTVTEFEMACRSNPIVFSSGETALSH